MMKITISDLTNDGTVISTCDLFIENEHGTIANLKTDKSYLRHGFAKKVMTTAVKVANELRLKSISLRVLKNSFMREWYIRLDISILRKIQKMKIMNGLKNIYNENDNV